MGQLTIAEVEIIDCRLFYEATCHKHVAIPTFSHTLDPEGTFTVSVIHRQVSERSSRTER